MATYNSLFLNVKSFVMTVSLKSLLSLFIFTEQSIIHNIFNVDKKSFVLYLYALYSMFVFSLNTRKT